MIDREKFYSGYREKFGKLNDSQKAGLEFILTKLDSTDKFNLATEYAYILATIKRETNSTYQPVLEGYWIKGNRKKALYNYYQRNNPSALRTIFPYGWDSKLTYEGRGRIQTTHVFNCVKIKDKTGIDVVNNPDLLLDNEVDWKVLELGFYGLWTGRPLSRYINERQTDYYNARKVVNGLDHAQSIADDAMKFYTIINFRQ